MDDITTRELIQTRYARNRTEQIADSYYQDDVAKGFREAVPAVENVEESVWAADEAYLARMRKGRSFTFTQLTNAQGVHVDVCLGTAEYWTEVLTDSIFEGEEETVDEIRTATEAEIVDFVMGGGIEDADDDDREFQRGWDEYGECHVA